MWEEIHSRIYLRTVRDSRLGGIRVKKIIVAITALSLVLGIAGCQSATRNCGGNTTLELEPNQKLEEITWKDDSLWYLTRPMTDDDIAETHTFQESSNFGVFEGSVTVIERKE